MNVEDNEKSDKKGQTGKKDLENESMQEGLLEFDGCKDEISIEEHPDQRLIRNKFGECGIKVYTLIDGVRSAKKIMEETGLSESKLVEMLEFMEQQNIIKLEYPNKKDNKEDQNCQKAPTSDSEMSNPQIVNEKAPEQQEPTYPKAQFDAGNDHFEKGDYIKAIEKYDLALQLDPASAATYFNRALAYYHLKNYDNSIADYNKTLETDPDNSAAYNNRGDAYYKKQDFYNAIKDYDKAISLNPNYLKAFYNRGLSYASLESYGKAISDFSRAIFLEPKIAETYHLRGLAHEYAADHRDCARIHLECAIQDFETALELGSTCSKEATEHLSKLKESPKYSEDKTHWAMTEKLVNAQALCTSPLTKLSNVAGMKKFKELVAIHILYPLQHKEVAAEYGKSFGGGFLLYGPPGCGKSHVIEAMAGEAGLKLVRASISDILNRYVGDSEKNLSIIFEEARKNQPCILFFDEIEALGGRREGMHEHWERTLVNQFLMETDGVEKRNEQILIIGATNAPWEMDHALRRSGRFARTVFVEPPDLEARIELFRMYAGRIKRLGNVDYEELARCAKGLSCANIKAICEKARDIAWKEAIEKNVNRTVEMNDFLDAISGEKSDVMEWFEIIRQHAGNPLFKESYNELVEYLEKGAESKNKENMFG